MELNASDIRNMKSFDMKNLLDRLEVPYHPSAQNDILRNLLTLIYSGVDEETDERVGPDQREIQSLKNKKKRYEDMKIAELKVEIENRGLEWQGTKLRGAFIEILENNDRRKNDLWHAKMEKKENLEKRKREKALSKIKKSNAPKILVEGSDQPIPSFFKVSDFFSHDFGTSVVTKNFKGVYYIGNSDDMLVLIKRKVRSILNEKDPSLKLENDNVTIDRKKILFSLRPGKWTIYDHYDHYWSIWAVHEDFTKRKLRFRHTTDETQTAGYMKCCMLSRTAKELIEETDLDAFDGRWSNEAIDAPFEERDFFEGLPNSQFTFPRGDCGYNFYSARKDGHLVAWALMTDDMLGMLDE